MKTGTDNKGDCLGDIDFTTDFIMSVMSKPKQLHTRNKKLLKNLADWLKEIQGLLMAFTILSPVPKADINSVSIQH